MRRPAALDVTRVVRTMPEPAARRHTLDAVDDRRGRPTWSADVAERITNLCAKPCRGEASQGMFRPTSSAAFLRPAPRSAYSALGHDRWSQDGLSPLRDRRPAQHEALSLIRKEISQ
ncbi:sugar nucleotide-binding protein [Streptomyces fulvoviolaceus]|uniref:sugar nucleotide-binding protein n=1 Tax=Streptomyces fulvoviolaceus TaxID=285535 RepID=UPI0004CB187B|nr:sugar nucleotide-binding protein [Streptomyces fulvoviolaceus]